MDIYLCWLQINCHTVLLHVSGLCGNCCFYMEIHDLPSNPVSRIKKKIGKKYAEKQEFWELSDYALFRKVAAEKPRYFYYWELLYWTGMRSGEASATIFKR